MLFHLIEKKNMKKYLKLKSFQKRDAKRKNNSNNLKCRKA